MTSDDFTVQDKQRFKTDDADSYDAVVDYFDRYTQRFSTHLPVPLLAMVDMPANGTVLDVGTGTGIIAMAVADIIGCRARVVGIDLSDGMLAMARKKAHLDGLQDQLEFLKMDAENLAFSDNTFDAVISLYALHHFPNPARALSEIYRVLKPGAGVVIAVGSSPALLSMDGFKAAARKLASLWRQASGRELSACGFIDNMVKKHIPQRTDPQWAEHWHGYTGQVKNMVKTAGFTNIREAWKGQYSSLDNIDDFWLLQMTFSSTARKRIQQADDNMLKSLKADFYQRCEQVLEKNGRLVYQTGAAIVAGVKAAR